MGGILKHCKALCAFHQPHHQLLQASGPGIRGASVNLAYSSRNRQCGHPHPHVLGIPLRPKRIEFRTPDPSCNGYLAFSAIRMAVLDGIQNKIDPWRSAGQEHL